MKQKNKLFNDAVLADLYYAELDGSIPHHRNRSRLTHLKPENVNRAAMRTAIVQHQALSLAAMEQAFLPTPKT